MIALIVLALVLNNFLDYILKQDMLKIENQANIRLISSCSVLCYFYFLRYTLKLWNMMSFCYAILF